jgi:iron complex outermembrane receptor protein
VKALHHLLLAAPVLAAAAQPLSAAASQESLSSTAPVATTATTASATSAAADIPLALPAGPLAELLPALAAQAGITVQADAALLRGVRSHRVAGRLPVHAALAQLLQGTGLVAREPSPGVFVLVRDPAASASATAGAAAAAAAAPDTGGPPPDPPSLPLVRAVARRADDAARPPTGAGAATRSGGSAFETPQAVIAIGRPLIDALGAQRLNDVLDHVPGVSRQNDFGGTWDNIALRGFAGHEDTGMSLLRNGMAGNRGYNAPRDSANTERFEFLRGPVGALYGVSEPGGTLNVVTRQAPLPDETLPGRSIELQLGRWNARRLALDLGDRVGGATALRLNAAAEHNGSFRDHVSQRRELLAPALAWQPAPGTTLHYDGEWLRQRAPLDRGVVAVGGQLGRVPASHFYGEPADGDITLVNRTHQLRIAHRLAEGWQVHAGLLARRGSMGGDSSYGHAYGAGLASLADDGWLWRQRRRRDFHSSDLGLQLDLLGTLQAGGATHRLLLGVEGFRFRLAQQMQRTPEAQWPAYGIDVFQPVHRGAPLPEPQPFLSTSEHQHGVGAYLQDEVALDSAWRLLLGLRQDRFAQRVHDRLGGTVKAQRLGATTPRIGLAWLPAEGWSAYASAGASFRPNVGMDVRGLAFGPERGRAREAGLKWQAAGGRLAAGLAAFDIVKRQVLVADPLHPDFSLAAAQAHSRGIEAELRGELAPGWRGLAAATRLTRALPQIPRVSASLLLWHDRPLGQGLLTLGGGVTHVGARSGDAGTPLLPSYTSARLSVQWQPREGRSLSLQVDNLFDRPWYASAYNDAWVTPGAPRRVTLALRQGF